MNILQSIQILELKISKAVDCQCAADAALKRASFALMSAQRELCELVTSTTITGKSMTPTIEEDRVSLRKAQAKSFGGALVMHAKRHGVKRVDANGNTYFEVPS